MATLTNSATGKKKSQTQLPGQVLLVVTRRRWWSRWWTVGQLSRAEGPDRAWLWKSWGKQSAYRDHELTYREGRDSMAAFMEGTE